MDNDFILLDRKQKIKQIISKYGEENFYLAFSGGKDSLVLSHLIDEALDNNIPRLYANTGIEFNIMVDFIKSLQSNDKRIHIIEPTTPIKTMLEEEGYPFKSKNHSSFVAVYQRNKKHLPGIEKYLNSDKFGCPDKLKYQFENDLSFKISDKCCTRLKEEPVKKWCKQNNKIYGITGIRRGEGGRRYKANCLSFRNNKLLNFNPLVAIDEEWEEWYIESRNIKLCALYYEPFNFSRTGCKGCPFNIHLQKELNTLEKLLPNEKKQCEVIWAPVYAEYRKLNFRLKGD